MKMRPGTQAQATDVQLAINYLKLARECLRRADSPKALEAVRRALKSTEGAQRHVERRTMECTVCSHAHPADEAGRCERHGKNLPVPQLRSVNEVH